VIKRNFWIDTDTASDDSVAILMALRWPDVHVEGISIVAGNVPVNQGSKNARYTVELVGAEIPIFNGMTKPLFRLAREATKFHGADGMGNMNYPAPIKVAKKKHAVQALVETFSKHKQDMTLVTLGPLTNIAMSILLEPRFAQWVEQCYVMGGAAATLGNTTPAAEYNIWSDPEAASIVFHSGMKILMIGWEHCRGKANLNDAEIKYIRSLANPLADFTLDCNRIVYEINRKKYRDPGITLPDPIAMSIALDPSICLEKSMHSVEISLDKIITRGMTIVDQLGVLGKEANIEVCWKINIEKWKKTLLLCIKD